MDLKDMITDGLGETFLTSLQRAIKDGYINIIGNEGKRKIIYVASNNHTENYEDPEEMVRAEFYAELIYKYEYPVNKDLYYRI